MDAESFKRMFLPCHAKLYGVACRLLENAEDAEDLIQEAYLKLWSKREELTLISNPEAFAPRHRTPCPPTAGTRRTTHSW